MEWDTGAAHAVLKGAGGNVRRLDTLQELSYDKPGMHNPFFVASSNDMELIAFEGGASSQCGYVSLLVSRPYDIRGELGVNFNTNIAYRTGCAHDYCIPGILG